MMINVACGIFVCVLAVLTIRNVIWYRGEMARLDQERREWEDGRRREQGGSTCTPQSEPTAPG